MVVTPTVGRKVWFRPSTYDRNQMAVKSNGDGTLDPLDATVVAVWNDRLVNLVIFDVNGQKHVRTSAILRQEGDEPPNSGGPYCEWMPYQSAQAKKHAAKEPTV